MKATYMGNTAKKVKKARSKYQRPPENIVFQEYYYQVMVLYITIKPDTNS